MSEILNSRRQKSALLLAAALAQAEALKRLFGVGSHFLNAKSVATKEGSYMIGPLLSSLAAKLKGSPRVIREIIYGLLFHDIVLTTEKERGHLDNLFMLVIFGDLIGLPLLPPYYSLRLLPHIVPSLETWKRRILRERDLTDFVAHDLS